MLLAEQKLTHTILDERLLAMVRVEEKPRPHCADATRRPLLD